MFINFNFLQQTKKLKQTKLIRTKLFKVENSLSKTNYNFIVNCLTNIRTLSRKKTD